MSPTIFSYDIESFSEQQIAGSKSVGLYNYATHPSTEVTMFAYSFDKGPVKQLDLTDGDTLPPEVIDALTDPHVERWAYNGAFERVMMRECMGIPVPYENTRCTMVLAFMRCFKGRLSDVAKALGLPTDKQKDARGTRLISKFCQPTKPTKAFSGTRRTRITDPQDWQDFLDYNRQDVIAEMAVHDQVSRFPVLDSEWKLYEIDQQINDHGLPVSREFLDGAISLVARRQAELFVDMRVLTGIENPNSIQKLLPWLQEFGYPASDLRKDTIKKVIEAHDDGTFPVPPICETILKMRQQASRTSVKKYNAIDRRLSSDKRLRHCFQFAGASRTNRWAGRGPQPQNLVRPPKLIEEKPIFVEVARTISQGDYNGLSLLVSEPMTALAGCIRGVFQAEPEQELHVADLSSIESCVIAWLAGCKRMLRVFAMGLDTYKDFGVVLYNKLYEEITKAERNICKPPVLGCGFGLGGGRLIRDKKTGLWGYADAMGIKITQQEAHRQVDLWRKTYPEIPQLWQLFDQAFDRAMRGLETVVNGLCCVSARSGYVTMELPSRRLIYYYNPKYVKKEFEGKNGPYTRTVFTCDGINQATTQWGRIQVTGPKACLGSDTLVLTDSGFVKIVDVQLGDLVWDGEAWVSHDGVVFNGYRETIEVDGVSMTHDHNVLTENGWTNAQDTSGYRRYPSTLPGQPERKYNSRHEQTSGFCSLAVYDRQMPFAHSPVVEELRGARDYRLPTMAGFFSTVLEGYGAELQTRSGFGQNGQRQRVFTGKLQVGDTERKFKQHSQQRLSGNTLGLHYDGRSCETIRHREDDSLLPAKKRLSPVFDILNAGPKHRFTVAGKTGTIIVSNCENAVQAIARDILACGIHRNFNDGFNIVGHVHDEIISMQKVGDNYFTLDRMIENMTVEEPWMKGLPLKAAGHTALMYMKDG